MLVNVPLRDPPHVRRRQRWPCVEMTATEIVETDAQRCGIVTLGFGMKPPVTAQRWDVGVFDMEWPRVFAYKYAADGLLCLHADGPMRWTDISRSMSERTGTWLDPQAVNRALTALKQLGLVQTVNGETRNRRNRLYALTRKGVEMARLVDGMANQINQHRGDKAG